MHTAWTAALSVYVMDQGQHMPFACSGLLQHETKLSVLNFSLRKAHTFSIPLPNKAPLLLVTGVRCVAILGEIVGAHCMASNAAILCYAGFVQAGQVHEQDYGPGI